MLDALKTADLGEGVTYKMKGEDEEREAAGAFLMKAFGAAIFLIFAILLAQFNQFSSVLLVLSAVVLSTIGVLIGLMVMGQAFGVVMTGVGVIANAGVIVNNNIVLIDTYDRLQARRPRRLRGDPGDLPRACAAGGADGGDRHARRARHRVRRQHRLRDALGRDRRALDAMVDPPLDGDRLRPRLRDDPDADRHARLADGDRQFRGVAAAAARERRGGAARGSRAQRRGRPEGGSPTTRRRRSGGGGVSCQSLRSGGVASVPLGREDRVADARWRAR